LADLDRTGNCGRDSCAFAILLAAFGNPKKAQARPVLTRLLIPQFQTADFPNLGSLLLHLTCSPVILRALSGLFPFCAGSADCTSPFLFGSTFSGAVSKGEDRSV